MEKELVFIHCAHRDAVLTSLWLHDKQSQGGQYAHIHFPSVLISPHTAPCIESYYKVTIVK